MESTDTKQKSGRLVSLDAFRGFDMMMIIGFDAMMWELGRWIYGGPNWLTTQFSHPQWYGLSFYDCIFPTFLFIAGLSFPFSYARQVEKGLSSLTIHLRIFKRAAILIALGWVIDGPILKVGFSESLRYGSVLGKIGLGSMLAALYYVHFRRYTRIFICAGLIVGYAVLLNLIVAPDFPNSSPFSVEGNFIGWLDRLSTPGKLSCGGTVNGVHYPSLCEASGLYVTFFAAATAMLGTFAGEIVRSTRFSGARKALHLVLMAAGLFVAGLVMLRFVPLSKKLWSPSFMLLVGSGSTAVFALFYYLADVRMWRGWTTFFTVIGLNSITVYMLFHIFDFYGASRFFLGGISAQVANPSGAAFVVNCGAFALAWLAMFFLYRKNTFLKV